MANDLSMLGIFGSLEKSLTAILDAYPETVYGTDVAVRIALIEVRSAVQKSMKGYTMPTATTAPAVSRDQFSLQNAEFDAVRELSKRIARLDHTAIVDDDYPEMRHRYESALHGLITALKDNGRFDSGSRGGLIIGRFSLVPTSIVQDWAAKLGLRHQGVLVSAIRGCDSSMREDHSKYLVRMYRGVLLRAHVGDVKKAASFMIPFDDDGWRNVSADFLRSIDHYPNHWILHFMHACEIVGYKHPETFIAQEFNTLYRALVKKFHLLPESEIELDRRLNADEETFKSEQA